MQETKRKSFSINPEYRRRLDTIARSYYTSTGREGSLDLGDPVASTEFSRAFPLEEGEYSGGKYETYVVQMARPGNSDKFDGRDQNKREVELWRDTHSELLTPVLESDREGYWVVKPFGSPVGESRELSHWIQQKVSSLDSAASISDYTEASVRVLDGQFRLFTYGLPGD